MKSKITPCLVATLVALFSAMELAACSERPQRVMHEGDAARTSESWNGQFRDRTLKQGESERMGH
jgi:hypothetical protein